MKIKAESPSSEVRDKKKVTNQPIFFYFDTLFSLVLPSMTKYINLKVYEWMEIRKGEKDRLQKR